MSSFPPQNSSANIESHAYNNKLRSAGNLKQKSISDIVQVDIPPVTTTKTTDNQNVPITTTMDQLIAKVAGLNTTSVNPFDASTERVEDFLEDLDRHFRATNKEKDQDKLDTLVSLLAGKVRSWYRYQTEETKNNYTRWGRPFKRHIQWTPAQSTWQDRHCSTWPNRPIKTSKNLSTQCRKRPGALTCRRRTWLQSFSMGCTLTSGSSWQWTILKQLRTSHHRRQHSQSLPTSIKMPQCWHCKRNLRAFREAMVAQASVAAATAVTAATAATPTNPTPQHRQVCFKERQDHRERSKSRERSASRERYSQNFRQVCK